MPGFLKGEYRGCRASVHTPTGCPTRKADLHLLTWPNLMNVGPRVATAAATAAKSPRPYAAAALAAPPLTAAARRATCINAVGWVLLSPGLCPQPTDLHDRCCVR